MEALKNVDPFIWIIAGMILVNIILGAYAISDFLILREMRRWRVK